MSTSADIALVQSALNDLTLEVARLEAEVHAGDARMESLLVDLDILWIFLGAILVFFMQVSPRIGSSISINFAEARKLLAATNKEQKLCLWLPTQCLASNRCMEERS